MFGTESDDEVTHDMHAPFGSAEAKEARDFYGASMPNPTPHRGLFHYTNPVSGEGRVKACLRYTDSEGKRIYVKGTAHGWGTTIIIEGKVVRKTKEMAQDEAAHDYDYLKNEHEGRGFCDLPMGRKAKFFNEYNYPDDTWCATCHPVRM
jgi:hypothetical protein